MIDMNLHDRILAYLDEHDGEIISATGDAATEIGKAIEADPVDVSTMCWRLASENKVFVRGLGPTIHRIRRLRHAPATATPSRIDMTPPETTNNGGQFTRAMPVKASSGKADPILQALRQAGGEITDPKGLATARLYETVAHSFTRNTLPPRLLELEKAGEIERDIRGRLTFRIALAGATNTLSSQPAPAAKPRPTGGKKKPARQRAVTFPRAVEAASEPAAKRADVPAIDTKTTATWILTNRRSVADLIALLDGPNVGTEAHAACDSIDDFLTSARHALARLSEPAT